MIDINATGTRRISSIDEHRRQRTRQAIETQFANSDEAVTDISELLVTIPAWRAQARQAAAALGRKVRTGLSSDEESVWARLAPIPPAPPPVVSEYANGFRLFTNPWIADTGEDEDPWTDEGA